MYVYCIVPPTGDTTLVFNVDGEITGGFGRPLNRSKVYEYNVLAFHAAGLPDHSHSLVITAGTGGGNNTLVLLDRIVYT